jgi:cyclopropane fatty-acyl-phospholipid synthase-like methyltransferase
MSALVSGCGLPLEVRARQSLGSSSEPVHGMVARALAVRGIAGGQLVDVGCGQGDLWRAVGHSFDSYVGLDAVRYERLPHEAEFWRVDFDAEDWAVAAGRADVVAALETIEHVENPWAFLRHVAAIGKPGAWVLVTTPNQLSLLSLATLLLKRRHSAFQDDHYPAHRTALLEVDVCRAMAECGLVDLAVEYSLHGRLPFTSRHYPAALARRWPCSLSDNLLVIGRKPGG